MQHASEAVFVVANRFPQATTFQSNRRCLAFASGRQIFLADLHGSGGGDGANYAWRIRERFLVAHSGAVVAVQWAGQTGRSCLVSAGSDGQIFVWIANSDGHGVYDFRCHSLSDHHAPNSVHGLAVHRSGSGRWLYLAATSSDGSVSVYVVDVGQPAVPTPRALSPVQVIGMRGQAFPTAIALTCLSERSNEAGFLLLAVASTDLSVAVYTSLIVSDKEESVHFQSVIQLTGHTDWVTAMDFGVVHLGEWMLATGGQDKYIRLWSIRPRPQHATTSSSARLSTKDHVFSGPDDVEYVMQLEAVLMGHEDWVYSVAWQPALSREGQSPLSLLSASADKSIMVWNQDPDCGVWTNCMQLGDFGGHTFAVFAAHWGSTSDYLIGHGYHGDIHLWALDRNGSWGQLSGLTGHYGPVHDLSWDPTFTYLTSTSKDRTTRCFGPWHNRSADGMDRVSWHELARPQIHGHDLQSLAFLDPFRLATASDGEKVIRVFECPENFVQILREGSASLHPAHALDCVHSMNLPQSAALPSLSLTNTASITDLSDQDLSNEHRDVVALQSAQSKMESIAACALRSPPTEEMLLQFTLWPEVDKVYGHSYDVYCLTASYDGALFASASTCRAMGQLDDAAIRLWSCRRGEPVRLVATLQSHTLTVTGLVFSWDSRLLLSVGRDRMWNVWSRQENTGKDLEWMLESKMIKAHTRIIWAAAFAYDDSFFVTGSRDKSIKIWRPVLANSWRQVEMCATFTMPDAVTALSAIPIPAQNGCNEHIFAAGFENGTICVWILNSDTWEFKAIANFSSGLAHDGSIQKLVWRVLIGDQLGKTTEAEYFQVITEKYAARVGIRGHQMTIKYQLASCGVDGVIRIRNIEI